MPDQEWGVIPINNTADIGSSSYLRVISPCKWVFGQGGILYSSIMGKTMHLESPGGRWSVEGARPVDIAGSAVSKSCIRMFVYYASHVPINAYFDIDSRCCHI